MHLEVWEGAGEVKSTDRARTELDDLTGNLKWMVL